MKKIYSIAFSIMTTCLMAQTIDSSDVLIMESRIVQKTDTSASSLNLGNTGTGQTWDFSSLDDNGEEVYIVNWPGDKPGASSFPTANRSLFSLQDDSSFQFFNINANNVLSVGFSEELPDGTVFTQPFEFEMLEFPVTMGDMINENLAGIDSAIFIGIDPDSLGPHPFVDSLRFKTSFGMDTEIDAQGTITTPFGTFAAFRQYVETTTSDSTLMYANGLWQPISTTIELILGIDAGETVVEHAYRWWSENSSMPLVEGDFDPGNNEFIADVLWLGELVIGIEESDLEMVELEAYPIPADELLQVTIPIDEAQTLVLYDLTGREMLSERVSVGVHQMDVSTINTGIYLLILRDNLGNLVGRKKIQVL